MVCADIYIDRRMPPTWQDGSDVTGDVASVNQKRAWPEKTS